jgi:hypothetical protein
VTPTMLAPYSFYHMPISHKYIIRNICTHPHTQKGRPCLIPKEKIMKKGSS